MNKVVLKEIDVRLFVGKNAKIKAASEKINEYIRDENLDVVSVSFFKENENEYLFALTVR